VGYIIIVEDLGRKQGKIGDYLVIVLDRLFVHWLKKTVQGE